MDQGLEIDHNKVSRVWNSAGPKLQNVTIKTLFDIGSNMVILEFADDLGPVFRATFDRLGLRNLVNNIYDSLLEIDLDDAEKARADDEKSNS